MTGTGNQPERQSPAPTTLSAVIEEFRQSGDFSDAAYEALLCVVKNRIHSDSLRDAVPRHVNTSDMAQEAMCDLYNRIHAILSSRKTPGELRAYLHKVASNRVVSEIRKECAKKRPPTGPSVEEAITPDRDSFGHEFEVNLRNDLAHFRQTLEQFIEEADINTPTKEAIKLHLLEGSNWTETYERIRRDYGEQTPTRYRMKKECEKICRRMEQYLFSE